jgi:cupin 2 domain-containing protein
MNANLFAHLPGGLTEEGLERLAEAPGVWIERIVSWGQASPAEGWYDQEQTEFVVLLQGEARLEFADGTARDLVAGDWVTLAPHCRHRVGTTSIDPPAIWLAVHWR